MGKGSRNRLNREVEPKKEIKKKVKRTRKPLSATAKRAIAGAICLLLVAGILFGSLVSAGTFKRGNILVHSKVGAYDLDQQTATAMLWLAYFSQGAIQYYYQQDLYKQYGYSSADQVGIITASGVQETLLTAITENADMLREYIAVCDYAYQNNIALTKEERKEAGDGMKSDLKTMASSLGYTEKGFIKLYVGCNVKMKDFVKAAEIQALCSKVYELKEKEYTDIVDADTTESLINQYVKENPESFYSTDYYLVSTENATLKDALLATKTPEEFKIALVKDAFENGDSNFKTVFNKHGTTLVDDAKAVLAAIQNKEGEELTEALTAQGMTPVEYTKDDANVNASLNTWLFTTSNGVKGSADIIYTMDTIYVAIITAGVEGSKLTAAVKEISKQSGETYGSDTAFKENFYKTVLEKLDLYEKAEGDTLYTDTEDNSVKNMLDEIVPVLEKVLPATKAQAFIKEAAEGEKAAWEAGSYQEWMFKGIGEDFKPVNGVGAVTAIAETKEENGEKKETGKFNVYMIVDAMKMNNDPLVNGGYIKFSGEGHADAAQAFLDSLNGVTGDALAEKFSSYTVAEGSSVVATPSVSETISESGISETTLSVWLFDEGRTANNTIKIPVADDAEKTEDTSCTYVAFYLDRTVTWKSDAKSGYINDQVSDWAELLIVDYALEGTKRIKDKTPPETETETEAETDEHGHAAH